MDFMTDLPESDGNRYLWVIKDRLSKWVALEAMPTMKAEDCATKFMDCWVKHHGLPSAMTSDRGTNWTSTFWKELCRLLGVKQQLSSAYHPQTDGGPERLNQEVQAHLRNYINQEQTDWKKWLSTAQLALNGHFHSGLGTSPFFATHGYDVPSPIPLHKGSVEERTLSASKRAAAFVDKMKKVNELCQTNMAAAAQNQEDSANRTRNPAPVYRVGDKVWLNLKNYRTTRPKRSLDAKHAKYTVAEVLSPVSIRLSGIPGDIHPVFHTDLLRPAASDPLPGQETDDNQPDPVLIESHEEYHIEEILCARQKPRSRGKGREALVKWTGHYEPTWEPLENLVDTAALDVFETKYGSALTNDGPRGVWEKHKTGTRSKSDGHR
jgi:transposase InsO family protein